MATTHTSSRSTAKARGKSAKKVNALTLLKQDHDEVSALFDKYEKGKEKMSATQKEAMAGKICRMLTVHTTIEEEIFYPAVREEVEDAEELLGEANVEHQSAKDLIAQIQDMSAGDELYDAKVKVLGEYVKHHVKEEQNEMFPEVRKSELDVAAVGERLAARKAELMQEEE
jgi:hemerythrin superfamily protein